MIQDGFGPASVTMPRDYLRWRDGTQELPYDSLHVGSTRTFSTTSRITDSPAGGTALATGVKTYDGAIAVDTSKRPVGTILEGVEQKGLATGLVVTSRLTQTLQAEAPRNWCQYSPEAVDPPWLQWTRSYTSGS